MSLVQELEKLFPHQPNNQQKELFRALSDFMADTDEQSCFVLKGYAGTGKTTVISTLVKVLSKNKIKFVLLAPTGRAAKVLSAYSGKAASTIHRKIYRKRSAITPDMMFNLTPNLQKD